MIKVYIASPYTIGDKLQNVERQMEAANTLINLGFAVYVPLLNHFVEEKYPQPYQTWLDMDLEYLTVNDCLLRLPGESEGADIEVAKMKQLGKPVFYDIESLINYSKLKTKTITEYDGISSI